MRPFSVMLAILLSMKKMESLKNRIATHSGMTPLFSIRAISLASLQRCKRILTALSSNVACYGHYAGLINIRTISGIYDIYAVTEIKRNPTHIPSRRCRPRIVSRRRRSARSRSRTRRGTGSSRASRYSHAAPASR